MFLRLLWESFVRQRRRKALAGIAILLGTTAVTAMLALATTIGDRIHRELAVYGANIVVTPKADALEVKVGGEDLKPATGGAYLKESDLEKLKGIFWANNITGVSPELSLTLNVEKGLEGNSVRVPAVGYWFDHEFGNLKTGAPSLHPWWKIKGHWPSSLPPDKGISDALDVVLGTRLAQRLHVDVGDFLNFDPNGARATPIGPHELAGPRMHVVGIASTGGREDDQVIVTLHEAQLERFSLERDSSRANYRDSGYAEMTIGGSLVQTQKSVFLQRPDASLQDAISRLEISARTRPEDAFARLDPDKLSPKQHDIWYCRPYANSIAYQIMEAIPGSRAEQVRRVEQSEGTVLSRISGLMWLVSGAALLAACFAVSAAMATAVLERRGEIGLMRSLGASKAAIALLFYAESGLLAVAAGAVGFVAGSGLAFWLGGRIFPGASAAPLLNMALLPVVVGLALVVAVAGSTPSIRAALKMDPSGVLRAGA